MRSKFIAVAVTSMMLFSVSTVFASSPKSYLNDSSGAAATEQKMLNDGSAKEVANGFFKVNNFTYRILRENIISLYDCTETTKGIVNIPAYVDLNGQRYKVICVDDDAFKDCTEITEVKIPEGVERIGVNAFYGCTKLFKVEIPETVTSIGNESFGHCSELTDIKLPESIQTIGAWAFNGCENLREVTIPSNVTTIGNGTFNNCSHLASVRLPDGLISIGLNAFNGCEKLRSIKLPGEIISIGYYAFMDCVQLKDIYIPNKVKFIGYYAFAGCDQLENIYLPEDVDINGTEIPTTTTKVMYIINDGKVYITEIVPGTGKEDVEIPLEISGMYVVNESGYND